MTQSSVAGTGESAERPSAGPLLRLVEFFNRPLLIRTLTFGLTCLAIAAGIGTYLTFADAGLEGPDPGVVLGFLYLDLSVLLLLTALIGQQLVGLWLRRRQRQAGSGLQVRLVVMFSLVAVTPTIVVAIFALVVFEFAMRSWFSERISTAVTSSRTVAEAYLEEHKRHVIGDTLAIAVDLNRLARSQRTDSETFARILEDQALLRNVSEIVVFDGTTRVLFRTGIGLGFESYPIPRHAVDQAREGRAVILEGDVDRVRAVVRLEDFPDVFVYASRYLNPDILGAVDRTVEASDEFQQIEDRLFVIRITFAMIFAIGALLMLFAAVWVGLYFAGWFARPVGDLIEASARVSSGDLDAEVPEFRVSAFSTLSQSFNTMTRQLRAQRDDLVEAHRDQETRRRFTEAVLGGVSSGVIRLDADGRIELPNRAAAALLDMELAELVTRRFTDLLPEMAELLAAARRAPSLRAEGQVQHARDDRFRVLLARIVAERSEGEISGFVVTFDDITDLQTAQRQAAWADVARRVAHEIANPLTPIQLAADRLKNKFADAIAPRERTGFEHLVDLIQRQVADISSLLREFSAFARMPEAVMDDVDLADLLDRQTELHQTANAEIDYEVSLPDGPLRARCDERQMRQAVTNLLQNAADSIEGRQEPCPEQGRIEVSAGIESGKVVVSVSDNGRGLPDMERHRLTEPYVTTRKQGTGLGLAIVRQIMEDHDGSIRMSDRPGGGAVVSLEFPVRVDRSDPTREHGAESDG